MSIEHCERNRPNLGVLTRISFRGWPTGAKLAASCLPLAGLMQPGTSAGAPCIDLADVEIRLGNGVGGPADCTHAAGVLDGFAQIFVGDVTTGNLIHTGGLINGAQVIVGNSPGSEGIYDFSGGDLDLTDLWCARTTLRRSSELSHRGGPPGRAQDHDLASSRGRAW